MSIGNTGNEWEYGHITKRLQDTMYDGAGALPTFSEYASDGVALPWEAPWPAVRLGEGYDLHVVPRQGHLLLWLVGNGEYDVVVESRLAAGRVFRGRGQESLAAKLNTAIESHSDTGVPEEVVDELAASTREWAADKFADPFDSALRLELRRPQARWIIHRLANVEADIDDYGRTTWKPTITGEIGEQWEPTYTTEDFVSQYPTGFVRDFNRRFDGRLKVRNDCWFIWYSMTRELLTDAVVRDYSDDDLLDETIDDYHFSRSTNGTFHLQHADGGEHGCRNAAAVSGEQRRASLERPPVPTVLCPHCSRHLKRLTASATLRAGSW